MTEYVIDSSALLAYLNQENGWERIEFVIKEHPCFLLAVNLTEVHTRLIDWHIAADEGKEIIAAMNLVIEAFDRDLALKASDLRASTRHLGLSLGDRACLALAMTKGAIALTADKAWTSLDAGLGIAVEYVRQESQ
jgi:PIN domain nuclease of toxin-antitoxin system